MQIQADRFLALTAMLAGFVPTGPQGARAVERVERATPGAGERAERGGHGERPGDRARK